MYSLLFAKDMVFSLYIFQFGYMKGEAMRILLTFELFISTHSMRKEEK
jgi:hypothetical protein